MFQYRVGTYAAISKLDGVDFELWHGDDVPNTKLKNYKGNVAFRHKQLPCWHLPITTNNGSSTQPIFPLLLLRLLCYNPDVILAEGASSLFALSVAFIYSKLFHKKIIMWSLGKLVGRDYKGVRGVMQKWITMISKKVDALFVYSTQAEMYYVQEGVDAQRIFKAVNVIDTTPKLSSIKKAGIINKAQGFNVVFVGTISKTKRLEMLVDAVRRMSQKYNDVKLHIIGDGDYCQMIKDYVEKKELKDSVVFHGRVTDNLNVLLSQYQVLALPGLGGLAIVDGMISSLPIISGSADGTEQDLIDEQNGFVTDKMTTDYMVEKLEYLYNSPEALRRMGKKSFEKITGEYSFESYMNQFKNCLSYVKNEK